MSDNTQQSSFPKGSRLGPYEIASSIGAGGMGEVFRARDTRLNRDVAVKVLPKDFVADADRLRRFEQEAKTLAALNHPNVLTIHDAGVHEGAPYLVSELLEGKTLREEMGKDAFHGVPQISIRTATDYALQIAQGLGAAHGKGIIHRDLKPENIFVTKDGRVKILDFGLAKLRNPSPALRAPSPLGGERDGDRGDAATIRIDADTAINTTEPGMLLGTPAYMSPEQVRGEPVDHRADIFAFGCVLYEMLSGTRAFRRNTPVESMNAVLSEDPPDLSVSNANVPPLLERVVSRCLGKSPDRRFQSASDLAFAIENAATSSTSALSERVPRPTATRRRAILVPWALAALCLAGLLFVLFGRRANDSARGQTRSHPMRKFELSLATPGKAALATGLLFPTISPDGQKIVYVNADGLWLRWLDQLAPPVALAKGENIVAPFWSPQSTDVGYFDGRNLMRASITGSRPATITTLPESVNGDNAGGAWLTGNRVIFATGEPALYEVPALGGKVATALAAIEGEKGFACPTALPDGRGVLFVLYRSGLNRRAIALWTPNGKRKVVLEIPDIWLERLAFSPIGHVLFSRWDGTRGIWAFPVSLEKLEAIGEPRQISDMGYLPSVSNDGTVVCATGGNQDAAYTVRRLVWVDRSGAVRNKVGPALPGLGSPRVSPDGQRVVAMAGETVEALEIWLFDIGTGQADRLTQNRVQDALPQWWDGGQAVIFSRFGATGGVQVLRKPAQAVGQEEIIVDKMGFCWTASAMGKLLLCRARAKWGYVSFADAGHTFVPLPEPLQGIGGPEFSPDGKRLAYRSAESGPGEIYVADFPEFAKLRQVSRGGGFNPQWHPASSELFFISSDGRSLMAARQKPGSSDFDAPAKVFDLPGSINPGGLGWPNCYCVSPDGRLFLMLQNEEDNATGAPAGKPNAMVIENWFEEFREKK